MKLQYLKFTRLFLGIVLIAIFFASCDDQEKPKTVPAVTTASVNEITTTSALGGGEIIDDGNAAVTASGLVFSSSIAEPTLADSKTALTVATGAFTSLLENLSSGTTYHVRAYATNSVGTGYGPVVDFTTGNAAPEATNVTITGVLEGNKLVTGSYIYSDAESNAESGSTYQWYIANDAAGSGETAIAGATNLTYVIAAEFESKFIRFGVTPRAAAGNTIGVEVKSLFNGPVGAGTTLTFTYNGASVTYGIITSPVTGRKWLDRNLGAPSAPTAANDFANYGDLFQWGRSADGHQRVTRNGSGNADMISVNGSSSTLSNSDNPGNSLYIVNSTPPADWRSPSNTNLWQGVSGINNPCPSGWRLATAAEWTAENLTNLTAAYTQLKITLTGYRSPSSGSFLSSTTVGRYWTSTIGTADPNLTVRVSVNASSSAQAEDFRATGKACRCIKNQ